MQNEHIKQRKWQGMKHVISWDIMKCNMTIWYQNEWEHNYYTYWERRWHEIATITLKSAITKYVSCIYIYHIYIHTCIVHTIYTVLYIIWWSMFQLPCVFLSLRQELPEEKLANPGWLAERSEAAKVQMIQRIAMQILPLTRRPWCEEEHQFLAKEPQSDSNRPVSEQVSTCFELQLYQPFCQQFRQPSETHPTSHQTSEGIEPRKAAGPEFGKRQTNIDITS